MKKIQLLLVAVLILSGCASGVTRAPTTAANNRTSLAANNQVSSVSIALTDEAKTKVGDNLKFNQDELLAHVKRALDAKSLLNSSTDKPRPNIQVLVKDMRVRSNFSAVMFGFMAGSDSITADVIVKDSTGREMDRMEVSASYALGGLAGGQDSARMGWLYETFAEETVKELTRK